MLIMLLSKPHPPAINTQVHEATKHTPYELVFGQPPRSLVVPDVHFRGQLDEEVLYLQENAVS